MRGRNGKFVWNWAPRQRNACGGYRPIQAVEEWSAGAVCLHAVHHTQTRPQHDGSSMSRLIIKIVRYLHPPPTHPFPGPPFFFFFFSFFVSSSTDVSTLSLTHVHTVNDYYRAVGWNLLCICFPEWKLFRQFSHSGANCRWWQVSWLSPTWHRFQTLSKQTVLTKK